MQEFIRKMAEVDEKVEEKRDLESQARRIGHQLDKLARELTPQIPEEVKDASKELLHTHLPKYFDVSIEDCEISFGILPGYLNAKVYIEVVMRTEKNYGCAGQHSANALGGVVIQGLKEKLSSAEDIHYDVGVFTQKEEGGYLTRLDGSVC